MKNSNIIKLIYNKNNFIKLLIICILSFIIYVLYNRINKSNEGFVITTPTTTQSPTTTQTPATTQSPTTTQTPTTTQIPATTGAIVATTLSNLHESSMYNRHLVEIDSQFVPKIIIG